MEAQEYKKLIEALRRCDMKQGCFNANCRYSVGKYFCDMDKVHKDAADAIEALQAEVESMDESCKKQLVAMASHVADLQAEVERLEPKRGEWVVKGANRIDCSVCGHSVCFAFGLIDGSFDLYKYCPECGAKMEVQG